MARPLSKINEFQFVSLRGTVAYPERRKSVVERLGVNGPGIYDAGTRCPEFSLISTVDCPNFDEAYTRYTEYLDLQLQEAVKITQDGTDFFAKYELEFAVLGVELLERKRIRTVVGGLKADSEALLRCRWRLCALLPRA